MCGEGFGSAGYRGRVFVFGKAGGVEHFGEFGGFLGGGGVC